MKRLLFLMSVCTVLLASATVHAVTVPITITNELAVPRTQAPVTLGLPFGPGELSDLASLRVEGPSGAVSPLQTRTLVTWYDGTPRWVLFDFPADLAAGGTAVYTVSDAGATGGTSPLTVDDLPTEFLVRTGTLEFTVSKTQFRLLDRAAVDSDGNGSYDLDLLAEAQSPGLVVVTGSGQSVAAHASAPTEAVVEEQGPNRITLRLRGTLPGTGNGGLDLQYVTRITAWANRSDVRIQQTLHNPNAGGVTYGSSGSIPFRSASLELATTLDSGLARLAGDAGSPEVERALAPGEHIYLHQDSSGLADTWDKYATRKQITFRGWQAYAGAVGSATSVASGDQARGWAELTKGDATAVIGIDDFWQEFPNAVEATGDGRLRADFFSPHQAGDHSLRGGEQKTHKVFLRFAADGGAATASEFASMDEPLFGLAPPEYYLSTRSFRRTVPVSQSTSQDYEDMQRATLYGGIGWRAGDADASLYRNRDIDDVYGWWDFGDAYADYEHEGDRANLENDMVYGMILQMVRSQNRDWWDFIADGAEHLSDIDIYHTQEDLGWRNGGFFTHDRTGSGAHRTDYPQTGHYNAQGLFTYHYMTGDPVVGEAALEVATNAAWRVLNEGNGGHAGLWNSHELRIGGWLIPIIMEGYKLTKDQYYLDGLLAALQQARSDSKCWDEGPGECGPGEYAPDYERDVKLWQLGMLMQGIGEAMEERTFMTGQPDPVGVQTLQDFGDFIQNWCWRPDANRFAEGYNHDDGTTWIGSPGNNLRVVDGLVYAYRVTGDTSLLTHVGEAFDTANRNPWYETSGVTFSNIKTQAVSNRNGGSWLEVVAEGIEPPDPCLRVLGTNPGQGQEWSTDESLLLLFSNDLDTDSFDARLSATGSESGTFGLTVQHSPFTASLTLTPNPVEGETITITLADGVVDADGYALDGDNDGTCGGAYSFSVVAGSSGQSGSDTTPPLNAGDVALRFVDGQVFASFTVPTDDGPTGGPTSLEIRTAVQRLEDPFLWSEADVVSGVPAPESPGNVQEVSVGYPDSRAGVLRVAVRFRDAAGNLSGLSNIAQDGTGPQVVLTDGPRVEVAAGSIGFVTALVSELTTGTSRVRQLRWRYAGETLAQARYVPLTPVGSDDALGMGEILVDGSTWIEGESYTLVVEGQDYAYNWSPSSATMEVAVVERVNVGDCISVSDVWPSPDETLEVLEHISLVFDDAVDMSTVTPNTVQVTLADTGNPLSGTFDWLVDQRVVRFDLTTPVDWSTQVRVEVSSQVQTHEGKEVMGAACTAEASFLFTINPANDPGPPVGGDLGVLAQHGLVEVDGYSLVLSDLAPGDTLRIFSTAGHLVHQVDVHDSSVSVDTSAFGNFEARHLILVYRGHRQHVVVGERAAYRSYLD